MKLQLKHIRVFDKRCVECKAQGKDVMITFMFDGDKNKHGVHDLFLTQVMAEQLVCELTDVVDRNKTLTVE